MKLCSHLSLVSSAALALALLMHPGAPLAQESVIDSTAAIVNSDIILTSELERTERDILRKFSGSRMDAISARHAALEQLISKLLVMQLARRQGIAVTDLQLDRALEQAAARSGQPVSEMLARLSPGATEAAAREAFREELIFTEVRRNHVRSRIQIADTDVRLLARALREAGNVEPRYHLAQLIVPLSTTATVEELRRAQDTVAHIRSQLRQGADFNSMAARYTPGMLAAQGGDLGTMPESQVPIPFLPAILKASPGDVVGPFRTAYGMHLIKLLEVSHDAVPPVTLYHASHILLMTSIIFSDEAARAQLLRLRHAIGGGELDFAAAARRYSEDSASAGRGGDLGYAPADTYDPPFAQALTALRPGELSQPVRSSFGWHLILLHDARVDKDSEQAYENKARSLIYQRHYQEELLNFENELREMAYIRILDPQLLQTQAAAAGGTEGTHGTP